jgi:hypothetical protein
MVRTPVGHRREVRMKEYKKPATVVVSRETIVSVVR